MDFNDERMTPENVSDIILEALADMIVSVDDVTDHAQIAEWLKALNAGWIREISDVVSKISDWGVNFKVSLVCQDCGKPMETEISTNPLTFFT
jgi:predicted transcriptional regulator